jgi:hypothetical protein
MTKDSDKSHRGKLIWHLNHALIFVELKSRLLIFWRWIRMQVSFAQLLQSSYRSIHSPGGDPTKKYIEQRSLPINLSIILFQF